MQISEHPAPSHNWLQNWDLSAGGLWQVLFLRVCQLDGCIVWGAKWEVRVLQSANMVYWDADCRIRIS